MRSSKLELPIKRWSAAKSHVKRTCCLGVALDCILRLLIREQRHCSGGAARRERYHPRAASSRGSQPTTPVLDKHGVGHDGVGNAGVLESHSNLRQQRRAGTRGAEPEGGWRQLRRSVRQPEGGAPDAKGEPSGSGCIQG